MCDTSDVQHFIFSPGVLVVQSSVFGAGSGNISLDDLACVGTEASLEECGHRGYYSHNCEHSEDVGVVCNVCKNYFCFIKSMFCIFLYKTMLYTTRHYGNEWPNESKLSKKKQQQ